MSVSTFFASILTKFRAKGSVFVKIAEADALALEAKGRVLAVDAVNEAKKLLLDFYEKEVVRVHTDSEAVKTRFKAVLAAL